MEVLKELVSVVTKNKVKSINLLGDNTDRVNDFYNRLCQNDFNTDKEASYFYFKQDPSHPQYRKLKNKLKNRLLNTLIFIDINNPKFTEPQKAFYECQKNLIFIKILLGRYARKPAIDLALSTLKYSLKFELTEITLDLYKYLRNHHALKTGDKLKYNKYAKLYDEYLSIFLAETKAEKYFEEISLQLVKSAGSKIESIDKAKKYFEELQADSKQIKSFRFNWIKYLLGINIYRNVNDYDKIIDISNQALDFFKQKKQVSPIFKGNFLFFKLLSLNQSKRFKEGSAIANRCLKIFEPGTVQWYNTMDLYFSMSMHTKNYNKSLMIYNQVINNLSFKFQPAKRKETWKINEAYLYYLYRINRLKIDKYSEFTKFRLNKFLNDVPIYSMDKRGYNIPILIIQIVLLILDRNYDEIRDRIEAIEKYTTRYLRIDGNFRSNCFIKMLLQIPIREFHKTAVIRHAKKYYKKLLSVPIELAGQSHEIEIIPFEQLWTFILESLDNKFIK